MTAIGIRGLSKRYGQTEAVAGIDVDVKEGEFVSLLGPSGCGKTTILRCVAGLERPDGGEIRIAERVMVNSERGVFVPPHRRGVGMVFQSYALWPHMTVFGNVAYPLRARRRPRGEIARRVRDALDIVGLADYGSRVPSALSGGQQQRVSLARALVSAPEVLLLDEPLSNLDAGLRAQLRHEIRRIHREIGTTSLYVTHDQLEAITLSDRILVIRDGGIEQVGSPKSVLHAPVNKWVAGFVGYENFLTGIVVDAGDDHVMVQVNGWNDPLRCGSTDLIVVARGDTVELAVRASNVEHGAGTGANVFDAVVQDATYVGDMLEYDLGVSGGSVVARMPERLAADLGPKGTRANFYIAPENIVLLRADSIAAHTAPVIARVS